MAAQPPAWPLPSPQDQPASIDRILADPGSRALLEVIAQVATSDASILLIGDSGTDKELIARHIHDSSLRRHRRFVAVNCDALSEALVDAELFGHESGAFPGAFGSQPGCFEAAHEGTLFLDEIDNLPLSIQARLMRALRERAVTRLGGSTRVAADVRVLAAGTAALPQRVASGAFRKDLYYHLNVVGLEVLPLHRRPGDILPLAQAFIAQYCQRLGYAPMTLTEPAQRKLLQHAWPGNSRELENVIHRTLLLTRGLHIREDDLRLSPPMPEPPAPPAAAPAGAPATDGLAAALAALCATHAQGLEAIVQDTLLLQAWRHNHYNQVQTARHLGISRNVLRSRLVRLGQLAPGREALRATATDDASSDPVSLSARSP